LFARNLASVGNRVLNPWIIDASGRRIVVDKVNKPPTDGSHFSQTPPFSAGCVDRHGNAKTSRPPEGSFRRPRRSAVPLARCGAAWEPGISSQ